MKKEKQMIGYRKVLCSLVLVFALALPGCEKPVPIEDLISHFENSGMVITEPDYGRLDHILKDLESGINTAPTFGKNRHQIKTVMVDGVMATIHQFKNSAAANRFLIAYNSLPDPNEGLPDRMRSMIGIPRLSIHKNIVLRITEGLGQKDDSETVDNIEKVFMQY